MGGAKPWALAGSTDDFLVPQAGATGAARAFGPPAPNEGNRSWDWVSRLTVLGCFCGAPVAFCFPAALAESGADGVSVEGAGCLRSSSSGTSSTVTWCASFASCFCRSFCENPTLSAVPRPFVAEVASGPEPVSDVMVKVYSPTATSKILR